MEKYCPDYKIIEWNESNFDLNEVPYVKEAYQSKKWAFITDYVRLYALDTIGGIYMDTDVEVLKNLDEFLNQEGFRVLKEKMLFQQELWQQKRDKSLYMSCFISTMNFIL